MSRCFLLVGVITPSNQKRFYKSLDENQSTEVPISTIFFTCPPGKYKSFTCPMVFQLCRASGQVLISNTVYIKKKNSTKCILQSRLVLAKTMFRKIYIQLICITKTRNGKLVALGWKQPLQEKLDIFSVLWNSVRSGKNLKGVFTRLNVW